MTDLEYLVCKAEYEKRNPGKEFESLALSDMNVFRDKLQTEYVRKIKTIKLEDPNGNLSDLPQ